MSQDDFTFHFDAKFTEYPGTGSLREFKAQGSGSRASAVLVSHPDGYSWIAAFAAPEPGMPALTSLLATPNPSGLCVVERGTAFLGDVSDIETFGVVDTEGPVLKSMALLAKGILLLVTPWAITAINAEGISWTSVRLAIDGLRLDDAHGNLVLGVADPQTDQPRPFALDLKDGHATSGTWLH